MINFFLSNLGFIEYSTPNRKESWLLKICYDYRKSDRQQYPTLETDFKQQERSCRTYWLIAKNKRMEYYKKPYWGHMR